MHRAKASEVLTIMSGGDPYAGYSYYVNSVTGSDSNAGTSSLAPFATIAKLLTVWQAGQSVGLAKGSTWNEMITVPGAGCGVYAYGTGNMPKLNAFDTIASNGWSKTGGQTNIYEITLSGMSVAAVTQVGLNLFEDTAQATYYTSLANLDAAATLPGYFVANPGTATPTLYINASGVDKDPASNGKTYEYNKRNACITPHDDTLDINFTVDGIWCRGGYQTGGVIRVCRSSTIRNCKVTDGNKYTVFIRDGCTVTGTTIINGHHPTEASLAQILYNENTPNSLGLTITNNTLGWSSVTQPRFSVTGCVTGHYNTSGTFGSLTITGNTVTNTTFFMSDPRDVSSITIANNTIQNSQWFLLAPSRTGTGSAINVTSTDDVVTTAIVNNRIISTSALANITATRLNVTCNAQPSSGLIYMSAAGGLVLNNCTFNETTSSIPILRVTSALANLTINTCSFIQATQHPFFTFDAGASGFTWVSDNNTFDFYSQFQMSIFGTSYTAFNTYQAAVAPQDANSTAV